LSSDYRKGFWLTFIGVLIFTPDALLIRLVDVEFLTLVVYRCTIGGLVMLVGFSLYCGRDFLRNILMIGVGGLVVVVLEGAASWTFYLALERTTVANVLVIFASTPLIAALLTRGLLLAALVACPFAQFPVLGFDQWFYLVIGASVVLPVALALLTLGPRYLPAPEVAMLTLLETIIGPVWVWIVIGEEPGIRTLLGGSVVVAALFFHALWRFRQTRQTV